MIYFVGAGSGAVDLITVRGAKLIGEADVIIYAGSLVNPEILDYANEKCEIFDSSKMNLEEIMQKMIENSEKNVIRLHTGDPCLYGAIREQMDILLEKNIDFDYVPGVSSFCGAASALKTEYTVPNVTQTVIITRMEGRTPVPEREKLRKLASHGSTMVLFLSTGLLPQVVEELLAGGVYNNDTPVALVYKATWEDEKVFYCTISTLEETAIRENITKTALITVGDFLNPNYTLSKLYDPTFTTEFRKGTYEN